MLNLAAISVASLLLTAAVVRGESKVASLPPDAKVTASFRTEDDKGPDKLFDGDSKTFINGAANTLPPGGKAVWVDLRFAKPLANLMAIETGESDPFNNYYAKAMEFWADSDGNGTYDTLLGRTNKLGPGKQSVGRHVFDGRLEQIHGLRIRVTQQNEAGVRRSFIMNEMRLVVGDDVPVMKATPELNSERAAEKAGEPEKAQPQPVGLDLSIVPNSAKLPGEILALPQGTKVEASFNTERGKGPATLFDGDLSTSMNSAGGIVRSSTVITSVMLRFPAPVENVGGVETGSSDPFNNYFPVELEFWADSDGDGRFDTRLGRTRNLGGGAKSVGRHRFESRLEKIHGLEIRCVEQNVGGGGRAWTLNEMRLVTDDSLPLAKSTPDSYRRLYFTGAVPEGSTVASDIPTEEGKGVDKLLDRDPGTFMNPRQGTAVAGKSVSVFVRFPAPVKDLAGIVLGKSDPFNNYVWQEMEIHADTTGSGKYDTMVTRLNAGSGERRFRDPVPVVHGLELRVTKQKLGGANRAFMLSGIDGLVFRDDPDDSEMRLVVEDFEDLSSWRTWATNTAQPEGERYYGGYTYLAGSLRPELAKDGHGVGMMRYCFKPGLSNSMWATRGRVNTQEGIIEGIRFWVNPQGLDCSISFELFDAGGKKLRTPGVKVSGNEWTEQVIDLRAAAFPAASTAKYPLRLQHIFLSTAGDGTGDVLLDDITLVGVFDRGRRLDIKPLHQGMSYAPGKPVIPTYRLSNALGKAVTVPLSVKLFSSFDPKRETPVATRTVEVKLGAFAKAQVPVDFGPLPYGHYHVELAVATDEMAAEASDQIAVMNFNGGRINKSPMWFGSQHPSGWIANVENEFVMKNVVVPLGMDCYRTGAPEPLVYNNGLMMVAGFGGVPPKLRLPNQKNDDRGEPTDYVAYQEWVKQEAIKKYLPQADKILGVEFYNEPDLPNFCYIPEIDTYLKMHRAFSAAFREAIPGIKIGTGGNTVQHGKEKKDFNPRMYTELAQEADVAYWHAHGALENYVSRHRMVEQWLLKGGRSADTMLLGNSEAGIPSGESAGGFLNQADNLVKKIGWAKAQKNSYFYAWFTTTDTYDPQGGYLNNENWGLITYNQRLKPSGQAYNELIRKLANTAPLGEVSLDGRLQTVHFERTDGTKIWLSWPRERGQKMLLRFAVSGDVTYTDMFGASQTLKPAGGQIAIDGNGYPFYLEAAKGATVAPAAAPTFVKYASLVGIAPGSELSLPLDLKNEWGRDAELTLALVDANGKELVSRKANVAAGASAQAVLTYAVPANTPHGAIGCRLLVKNIPAQQSEQVLPLQVVVAEQAPKAAGFKIDGTPDVIPNAIPIVLDKDTQIQELAFDPNTPYWAGAADLSAKAIFAHDEKGLYLCFEVTDQTHKPGPASEKLWSSDSIQIAFVAGSEHTEIGLTESEGGFGWCWISPAASRQNKKLDGSIVAKRNGDKTVYEAYLSFESLGIQYAPATPLRMTFLLNEDDGRGRVRIAKWFDGIAAAKDVNRFGFLLLQ